MTERSNFAKTLNCYKSLLINNTCNKFTLSLDLNPRSILNYLKIFSKLTGRNNHGCVAYTS